MNFNMLSERAGSLSNESSSFNFHRISDIPDTLYMVRNQSLDGLSPPCRGTVSVISNDISCKDGNA